MSKIRLIQELFIYKGKPVNIKRDIIAGYKTAVDFCQFVSNYGADEIYITEISENDEEHEINIDTIKEIVSAVDIPVMVGGNIERLEDVKKYLYAGAKAAVLDMNIKSNMLMLKEASERFGKDKIAVKVKNDASIDDSLIYKEEGAGLILKSLVSPQDSEFALPVIYINDTSNVNEELTDSEELAIALSAAVKLTYNPNVYGYSYRPDVTYTTDFMKLKLILKSQDIPVVIYEPKLAFSELTKNEVGMVPVVVQDYRTNEVLMLAYMNEEAFNLTINTGRMTYFSRSRNEIWEKGLTSGHFQYFKEIYADCDKDTLIAKVFQVGAACHTGKHSCFFNEIVKKDYVERNPHKVFEDVFNVIKDRKENPKQGSYTNYLFDKGIDKILKKVGEEATEIIIAAKNPNPEEIKYEISDFLYHVMVLMAEKGVTWEDITTELARR